MIGEITTKTINNTTMEILTLIYENYDTEI